MGLRVSLLRQPAHLMSEVHLGAPLRHRHMPPARQWLAGQKQIAGTVVKMVDFSYILTPAIPEDPPLADRRPNCARRLRPGISPGNTELIPVQAGARTGLGPSTRFPSRCCAASAGLNCPDIAPQ